jgi:hypothetical protein
MQRDDIAGAQPPVWEVGPAGGENAVGQTQISWIALGLGAGVVGGVEEIGHPSSGGGGGDRAARHPCEPQRTGQTTLRLR